MTPCVSIWYVPHLHTFTHSEILSLLFCFSWFLDLNFLSRKSELKYPIWGFSRYFWEKSLFPDTLSHTLFWVFLYSWKKIQLLVLWLCLKVDLWLLLTEKKGKELVVNWDLQKKMKIQCDVCEKAQATVICCADEAALCTECDMEVHAANKLASKHQRLLLECLSNKLPPCDICQVMKILTIFYTFMACSVERIRLYRWRKRG